MQGIGMTKEVKRMNYILKKLLNIKNFMKNIWIKLLNTITGFKDKKESLKMIMILLNFSKNIVKNQKMKFLYTINKTLSFGII